MAALVGGLRLRRGGVCGVGAGRVVGLAVRVVLGCAGRGGDRLGRRVGGADEVVCGSSAALALFGREPVGGAALVFGLAGGEGVGDATDGVPHP